MKKGYIKLPILKTMPDSRAELRSLSDEDWKTYVLCHLMEYYKEVDHAKILFLVDSEKKKERAEIEYAIKKHIRNWLKRECKEFELHEFIINLEPSTDGDINGYYDLKFEHSQWRDSYFSFEAKNLGKSKSITLSNSIKEYIYVENKCDGGVYRFMTQKYAPYLNFGGMLGFIIEEKDHHSIIDLLIEEMEAVYDDNFVGSLAGDRIIKNSIFNNPNTFESIHIRKDSQNDKQKYFRLYHIIMDFTKSE